MTSDFSTHYSWAWRGCTVLRRRASCCSRVYHATSSSCVVLRQGVPCRVVVVRRAAAGRVAIVCRPGVVLQRGAMCCVALQHGAVCRVARVAQHAAATLLRT